MALPNRICSSESWELQGFCICVPSLRLLDFDLSLLVVVMSRISIVEGSSAVVKDRLQCEKEK